LLKAKGTCASPLEIQPLETRVFASDRRIDMKNLKLFALTLAVGALALASPPAHADQPQTSITGTIVTWDGHDVVVKTDQGDLTFDVDKDIEKPAQMAVGNRITLWYNADEKLTGKIEARRIEMAPEPTPQVTTPPPSTPPPSTPVETRTEVQTSTTTEQQQLPSTASPLPLVGGLGALSAMAGALLLRLRRR